MYLRKSLKNIQFIYSRQKCLNWCQIVANRRHLSEDKSGNDDNNNKSVDVFDRISESDDSLDSNDPEDRVIKAKHSLNELINNLKSKTVFGESDPRLKELLAKPKFHIRRSARKETEMDTKEEDINEISAKIDERLILAAKGVAKTLSGEESKKTENDLLKLLRLQVVETNLAKEGKTLSKGNLESILADMKIVKKDHFDDRKVPDQPFGKMTQTRGQQRPRERIKYEDLMDKESVSQQFLQRRKGQRYEQRPGPVSGTAGLFTGEGLGIFEPNMKEASDLPKLSVWDRLIEEELQYAIAQPPRNAFEEMIKLTEEGKLWRYPINNEQGLEEEEKVPFYEHVMLDHLLEGFPETGPIRRFMELVIMGLSSNPYITIERKYATVYYYRKYFDEKEEILRMSGALG